MSHESLIDVGIGGSAFRLDDAKYMGYFPRMVAHFNSLLPTGAGGMPVATMGTGIAAGADLLAVLAFNQGLIPSVTFFSPGWFDVERAIFIHTVGSKTVAYKRDVDTVNHYHRLFKEGTGIDGLAEIAKALSTEARRATIYNYYNFYQRNVACAESCRVFWAYSCAPEVKGGTKHAWNAHERFRPRTSRFFNVLELPEIPAAPPAITEFQGEYRWLSNFAECQVAYNNIHFGSVENAYQAAKCSDPDDMEQFAFITPGQAKRLGRTVTMDPHWDEDQKTVVMANLLRQKFRQSPYREKLLATGDALIVEGNKWGDVFWGVCKGEGENRLGKLIMQIRDELRKES